MANQQGVNRQEQTTTIRQPASANFLVDSLDRDDNSPDAGNFSINKKNSLFNGFFNRLAVQEVVLEYGIPNVSQVNENDTFAFTYDFGAGPVVDIVSIPPGWYSVADALDTLVDQMNTAVGVPNAFKIVGTGFGPVSMDVDQAVVPGGTFEINEEGPAGQINNLGIQIFSLELLDIGQNASYKILSPRILPYRYLDIVSPQLTYNQNLKDADTSQNSRDVLYRWYFAWDNEPNYYDAYGFPILQGYRQFVARRLIAYPKQIKWNANQPIGSIQFQVFNDIDELVLTSEFPASGGVAELEFQMTFLLSED